MGWVWLIVIGAAAAGALALLGVGRGLWSLVGAALMLGATGYALQGRPDEPGSPAEADTQRIEIDPGIVKLRGAMMGNFTAETPYLAASDAMIRSEEHTSELQSLMRISYAVFCLKKKKHKTHKQT